MKKLMRLFKKEEGATAIEYGLIAFLISIVCIAVWGAAGTQLIAAFQQVVTALGG